MEYDCIMRNGNTYNFTSIENINFHNDATHLKLTKKGTNAWYYDIYKFDFKRQKANIT